MNSTAQNLSAQARAVLVTLAYTDQFEFPLTADEVLSRCLRQELEKKLSRIDIQHTLAELQKKKLVEKHGEFYCLCGRGSLVENRAKKETAANAKKFEVEQVTRFLQTVPWVRATYLTGSQAMNSADLQSDIDFMVVTQPNRLWLTRLLLSSYAQLQGKRRSWNREEPGSWCFNLWLDSDHLTVIESKQDSYRAYEVLQAKLLLAKPGFEKIFIIKNDWVRRFFFRTVDTEKNTSAETAENGSSGVIASVFDAVDWLAWVLQSRYMRRHQTTEKVGRGFAFFHPRDTRRLIADGWLNSLERCLPKSEAIAILQPYVTH